MSDPEGPFWSVRVLPPVTFKIQGSSLLYLYVGKFILDIKIPT